MKLLLFDVDGTLVLTGGAGVRAMGRAFEDVFGVADGFRGVPMPGRMDPGILADGLRAHDIVPRAGDVERFRERYFELLTEALRGTVPTPAASGVPAKRRFNGALPGVRPLLDALAGRDDVFLALLTGNYTRGARMKLEHFDLWRYFVCGAFGEDAAERHELVPIAVARAREAGCPDVAPHDVVVIGDTTRDVSCARDAGVRCLAVATGGDDIETLRAAGPDTVFPTLEDTGAVVAALLG
jgi:phosphoglycolate phosphatase-like HAD superfamily hydrolase